MNDGGAGGSRGAAESHGTDASRGTPEAATSARLWLADWRRRIADLYVAVRESWRSDPAAAWELWRSERELLFRTHPQSPVPAAEREAFRARHFPYDPAWRFDALPLEPDPADPTAVAETSGARSATEAVGSRGPVPTLSLPVSDGGAMSFTRVGWIDVPVPAGDGAPMHRRLAVYWMAGYADGIFLPFRDATNGAETYGAGRYAIDAAKSADLGGDATAGTLVVDFNFAFQPSCAWDPRWACPLAPPENRLDAAVRAGERVA